MDAFIVSPFFAFGLVGGLAGYIIGDFQRELRYRRDARRNLALAVARTHGTGDGGTLAGTVLDDGTDLGTLPNSNGNRHVGTVADRTERREARRRAVRGDNDGPRSGPGPAGRDSRRAASPSLIGAGHDC